VQRLLSDQNFNARVREGVLRASAEIMCVSVREFGMAEAVDARLLELAAEHGYVFLTHDAKTVPTFVYEMMLAGRGPPG
jgi:predicted nuclease of predicted toxin-antitoxin system